jgi:tetratricopeptide (TPR) repeat protein
MEVPMNLKLLLPSATELLGQPGRVSILEAEPGSQRSSCLLDWSQEIRAQGIVCHSVCSDFELGGPWAGLREIFESLIPGLEAREPELLVQHDYELVTLLPKLQKKLSPRNPNLTDIAPEHELVRLYPADRANRILHGLIDLLAAWKERQDPAPWLIICDSFDRSGYLIRKFFSELMRRRGEKCRLSLLLVCHPGEQAVISGAFLPAQLAKPIRLHFEPEPLALPDPRQMALEAEEIEARAAADPDNLELYLPALIRKWSLSDQPARALPWQVQALTIYAHRGFYHDAVGYGETALAHLEESFPDDEKMRLRLVVVVSACYCACGEPERTVGLVQQTLERFKSPLRRGKMRYVLAMLYARYLPKKDYQKAEDQLEIALKDLAEADLPHRDLYFEIAYNRNGLAFIRHRQGRSAEAISLCRLAHESLTENLAVGEHELHKSVLLYNQAQVYASLGQMDDAISYYTAVMKLDPNYAEYYNDRGNIYLKLGRFDLALADYEKAIALSPPFHQVRTNLGHCYRQMGKLDLAVAAYSESLDLDPQQTGVLVARAQCHETIGRVDSALADFDAALTLDHDQPLVLANRACLLYQEGRSMEALDDLNRATALSPDLADLYRNRAIVLSELGNYEGSASDLETYLRLDSTAADRTEVEQEISALRGREAPAGVAVPMQ